jgi:uncharacterized membrane protein
MSVKSIQDRSFMSVIEFIWHLFSLFMVGLLFGLIAASGAKLIWRHALAAVPWRQLAGWVTGVALLVAAIGLLAFGRDGRMATYAAMVLAGALALGWIGFRRRG